MFIVERYSMIYILRLLSTSTECFEATRQTRLLSSACFHIESNLFHIIQSFPASSLLPLYLMSQNMPYKSCSSITDASPYSLLFFNPLHNILPVFPELIHS